MALCKCARHASLFQPRYRCFYQDPFGLFFRKPPSFYFLLDEQQFPSCVACDGCILLCSPDEVGNYFFDLTVWYVFGNPKSCAGEVKRQVVAHAIQLAEEGIRVVVWNPLLLHNVNLEQCTFSVVGSVANGQGIKVVEAESESGVVVVVG